MQEIDYSRGLEKLMRENPGLPVIPIVDKEPGMGIKGRYWVGSIGESCIREFVDRGDMHIFKNDPEAKNINKEAWRTAIFISIEEHKPNFNPRGRGAWQQI